MPEGSFISLFDLIWEYTHRVSIEKQLNYFRIIVIYEIFNKNYLTDKWSEFLLLNNNLIKSKSEVLLKS